MTFYFALIAAVTCAVCNGVAAILQKVSAGREPAAHGLGLRLFWQLVGAGPYIVSIALDLAGGAATLYAVRFLPLFLVQSIVAASVVVTAGIDRIVLKQHIRPWTYAAIATVLAGLALLGLAATPETAPQAATWVRWGIVFGPLALAAAGMLLSRGHSRRAGMGVAMVSGLAFGATSVAGRLLVLYHPWWRILYAPMAFALVAYAALGLLLFTMSLQRGTATVMTAAMVATETLGPAAIGMSLLGDTVHGAAWAALILGLALTLGGIGAVLFTHKQISA